MPSPHTITDQLALASNGAVAVSVGWHAITLVVTLALMLGWRPSNRAAGAMSAAPIASAAAVALAFGNPFNASVLGALALALVLLARRLPGRVVRGSAAALVAGVLLVAFGSFYPHFVAGRSPLRYLYAAPTGLIPCPTLALVIGFALLGGGLAARAWALTLATVGLFYGVFGVGRLGVYLDIPLIGGAAALLIVAWSPRISTPITAASSETTRRASAHRDERTPSTQVG